MINRFLPSGDQTGLKSAAGVVATACAPDPSAFITKTSSLPLTVPFGTVRRKAIWFPSGDHAGSASTPVGRLGQLFGRPGSDDRQRVKRATVRRLEMCLPSRARSDRPGEGRIADHLLSPASSRRISRRPSRRRARSTLFLLTLAADQHHVGVGQAPRCMIDLAAAGGIAIEELAITRAVGGHHAEHASVQHR